MTVEAGDEHGRLSSDGIDPFLARQWRIRPVLMIPVASRYPGAGVLLSPIPDEANKLIRRFGRPQIDAQQLKAAADKMDVIVDEPGQHPFALQTQHLSRGSDVALHLSILAHVEDAAACARHGLRLRTICVHGPYFCIQHHDLRRRLRKQRNRKGHTDRRYKKGFHISSCHCKLSNRNTAARCCGQSTNNIKIFQRKIIFYVMIPYFSRRRSWLKQNDFCSPIHPAACSGLWRGCSRYWLKRATRPSIQPSSKKRFTPTPDWNRSSPSNRRSTGGRW
ncbi:MAG: hypothetical protein BWY83_03126 [bacterium ADurb.Bin478]|nr:MAG: hypothetical protein BWY83_03126 [bacterium ADurb.Bin478]